MYYTDIKQYDVASGPGVRVSITISGCKHQCKGCPNENSWDFDNGQPFSPNTINELISYLEPGYVQGLTILGGEPMEPANQIGLLPLARKFKEKYPTKTLWVYTGYTFDDDIMNLMYPKYAETKELLSLIDVIVDGPYIEEKRTLDKKFIQSTNQRIILVKESILKGETILWTDDNSI